MVRTGSAELEDSLKTGVAAFVREVSASGAIHLTDAVFPCYHWLYAAGRSEGTIAAADRELRRLLEPAQPLVIYLRSDVAAAWHRAVDQRGTVWLQEFLAGMNHLPRNRGRPLCGIDDGIAYFRRLDRLHRELLAGWPSAVVVLDADAPLEDLKSRLLEHLTLPRQPEEPPLSDELRARYAGVYAPSDDRPNGRILVVSADGQGLRTNLYWPTGCPLVARSKTVLSLEGTRHRIEFDGAETLIYHHGDQADRYRRIA